MLVPYNAAGADNAPMAELVAACKNRGLLPFVNYNRLHVVPPCTISETDAKEGLAILDEAFGDIAKHYVGSATRAATAPRLDRVTAWMSSSSGRVRASTRSAVR